MGTCVLVAALAVGAILVNFLPGQPQPLSLQIADGLFTAVAVPFAVVGALIVVHRPGNRLGGLLLVGALALGVEKLAQELVRYGVDHPDAVPALAWIGWVSNWAWVPALLIILLLLPVLFPDGRPLSPRWRPLVWVIVAWALVSLVGSALFPVIGDAPLVRNPLGLSGAAGAMLEQALIKLFVGLPVAAVAAAVSLIVRFRRARGVERQQLKWLAYAMGVLIVAPVVQDSWLGGWASAAVNLAFFAIPAAIGVAILRYRLYEIDRLINRTLVYGLFTALLAGLYGGLVLVLGQVFGGVGRDPPGWVVAGATLAVAVLFQPGRRRIQAVVDRRFNRRKYNAAKTVEAFSAVCGTKSTWMLSRPSCWRWPTRRCSRRRHPYGSDPRHKLGLMVTDTKAETGPTRLDPFHAIYGPAAPSAPMMADELGVWLSVGHRG